MLVFGDRVTTRDPRDVIGEICRALARAVTPGLAGHAALVAAFIAASELVQGVADAEQRARGRDARGEASDTAMRLLVALARAVAVSWDSGQRPPVPVPELPAMPATIEVRRAEGYAFYALYPEAYYRAAVGCRARSVIGIRSIGAGLAAIVAAASGADLPATVRPIGPPFARTIHAAPALVAEWSGPVAICDEGPGLSGRSFGAVLDVLEQRGITRDQIECFPSHDGELGPAASEHDRLRWRAITRRVPDVDALLIGSGALSRWIERLVGPLRAPLVDVSAGRWRAHVYAHESEWPASVTYQERRKFLADTTDGTYLARFVGLGRDGERAFERARRLAAAGLTPPVAGLCHGFLVERWLAATPARPSLERVGRYLAFRARELRGGSGASLASLAEMVQRNANLALGLDVALAPPARDGARVEIDGRMHAWEWRGDIKTDAYDHCAGHDLVGCQDIAWDIAAAGFELGLDSRALAAIVGERTGRAVDPDLLAFYEPCYLAFQLGRHALAEQVDPDEAERLRAATGRYAEALLDSFAARAR